MAKIAGTPDPIDQHVGGRMRTRRMMLGMSQEKLAEAFGLSFQQVQKYEKGANRMGAGRLQQAADTLGVAVPFFFEGAPVMCGVAVPEDTAPSLAYVNEFVSSPDGLALTKAFLRIESAALRRRIVCLVQEIAMRDGE